MLRSIGWQELLVCGILLLPLFGIAALVTVIVRRKPTAPPMPSGWYADPTQRHELRYWDGATWTAAVSDAGIQGTDAI